MGDNDDYDSRPDVAEITSLSPSIPRSTLSLVSYGQEMNPSTGARGRWTNPVGANNMRHLHAESVNNAIVVQGQCSMASLAPGRSYKGVFEIEIARGARGWGGSFEVKTTPPGSSRSYTCNGAGTFNLATNSFRLTPAARNGNLNYSLTHNGQGTKSGLTIKKFGIHQA